MKRLNSPARIAFSESMMSAITVPSTAAVWMPPAAVSSPVLTRWSALLTISLGGSDGSLLN